MSAAISPLAKMNFWTDLYKGRNGRASCLSSAVDVVYEEGKGRYAVANTKIPAGALLILEKPYSYCVYDQCAPYFCQHCLKPLPVENNVPCDHCADPLVIFCTTECRDEAWSMYHQHECGAVRRMLHCVGIKLHSLLLALRILVQTPIKDLMHEHSRLNQPNPKFGTSDGDTFNDLAGQFAAVMSLLPDEDFHVLPEVEDGAAKERKGLGKLCAFIIDQLKTGKSTLFTDPAWPAELKILTKANILSTMLLAILKRLSRNRQGILEHCKMQRADIKAVFEQLDSHKATAVYPTAALLNHGCMPNIHMIFQSHATMQARAITPIKAGEPLVHCYGPKFGKELKFERRQQLQNDYLFECSCAACISTEHDKIESDMNVIKCDSCSGEISIGEIVCSSCGADGGEQREKIKALLINFGEKISSSPDFAKRENIRDELLAEWTSLETRCHEQHKQLNELRGKLGALIVVSGWSTHAERLLVQHVAITKLHSGPLSLRTALAVSRLCCAYREHSTDKYWLSAALMIRIHLNHFGTKHVRAMFLQNGLLHFLPALDMIEAGAV